MARHAARSGDFVQPQAHCGPPCRIVFNARQEEKGVGQVAKALGIGEIGKTNLSGSVATAGVVLNGDASKPLYMEMKFPLAGGLIQFFKIGAGGYPEQTMDTVYTVQRSRVAGPRSGPSLSSVLNR